MNTSDIFILLLILLVTVVPTVVFVYPKIHWQLQTWRFSRWPPATATVHMAGAEYIEGSETELGYNRSLFGYSYEIDGVRYAGLFAIAARDAEEASLLQHKLDGQSVSVRFNPARPGVSVLVDREIEGFRAMQTPRWLRHGTSPQQLYLASLSPNKLDTPPKR
jgi:hypothetical protein